MCLQHLELNTLRKHAYILLLAFVLPRSMIPLASSTLSWRSNPVAFILTFKPTILEKHPVGERHAHSSSARNCREWLGKLIRQNFTERKGCPAEVRSERSSRYEKLKRLRLCNFVARWRLRGDLGEPRAFTAFRANVDSRIIPRRARPRADLAKSLWESCRTKHLANPTVNSGRSLYALGQGENEKKKGEYCRYDARQLFYSWVQKYSNSEVRFSCKKISKTLNG